MKKLIAGAALAVVLSGGFVGSVQAAPVVDVENKARLGILLADLNISYLKGTKATSKYLLKEIAKITNK